jgi:hypothetical protein
MTNTHSKNAAFISIVAAFAFSICFSAGQSSAAPSGSGTATVSASSLIPANRFAMNEGGDGDVSEGYYACVGQRYGREFQARIAGMQKKGRKLNYQSALDLTGSIIQKAQYCADQEKGAKVNLRHLAQVLESN